jgi:hypothetical protein
LYIALFPAEEIVHLNRAIGGKAETLAGRHYLAIDVAGHAMMLFGWLLGFLF